ncbi:hypothetical protein Trydic_g8290 [Trypoxylus dichotomus]
MTRAYWESPAQRRFSGLSGPLGQGRHADFFSVARVRPRTSKGITDLLLFNLVPDQRTFEMSRIRLASRLESRSLSELTRQIAPPTRNGHVPPPTESRKSCQSVNPSGARTRVLRATLKTKVETLPKRRIT